MQPMQPVTYSIPPAKSEPVRTPQSRAMDKFADLLKAVTPEESSALTEAFGSARPQSKVGSDHRGRHLDVRA